MESSSDAPEPAGWQRLVVEPRRLASVRDRSNAHWLAVAAVCVGALMGQIDASIVTVALPTLQRTFHVSLGAVTWVGLSYLLVLVATVTAVGRFADMWGRKLLYVYGFAIFVVGSALCALAPTLLALCGFRALQAVGAAMLQANSVAIIVLAVPARARNRAIGIQGAAQAIGLALGPTVGGLLLAAGGWRLIFLVNVPVGLVGGLAALALVPRSRHLQARVAFDWRGFALFFPAVVTLLIGISLASAPGGSTSAIALLLVAALALAVAFVGRERRVANPMIDPALFRRVRFSMGIATGLISYLVMFGVLFVMPFYLERSVGFSASRAGLELMVMPLMLGVVAPFAGRLADRVGSYPLTVGGMVLVAATLATLGVLRPSTWLFLVLLGMVGVGLGLFTPPNNASVMGAAPPEQAAVASGVLNMTRGMGTALGLAVTGLVFSLSGGDLPGLTVSGHAFAVTAFVLALAALGAAALSRVGWRRGRETRASSA